MLHMYSIRLPAAQSNTPAQQRSRARLASQRSCTPERSHAGWEPPGSEVPRSGADEGTAAVRCTPSCVFAVVVAYPRTGHHGASPIAHPW